MKETANDALRIAGLIAATALFVALHSWVFVH